MNSMDILAALERAPLRCRSLACNGPGVLPRISPAHPCAQVIYLQALKP